jgi:outer membrane PBP1 activator LpoA protein
MGFRYDHSLAKPAGSVPIMLRSVLMSLCAALLLAGCGGMPSRERQPETAVQAERLYADGEYAASAQAFLDASAERRSLREYYRLRAAEAWREEGELEQARAALDGVTSRKLSGDEPLRLSLLQAELALDRGDAGAALALLAMPSPGVPDAYRARFHFLRASANESQSKLFAAAAERALMDRWLATDERADNNKRIQQLLLKVGDDALYRESAALPAGHPLYVHAGRMLSSRGLALPRPYERSVGIGANAATRPAADVDGYRPYTEVALLLPASGPFALAARSVRDGFMTAYFAESRQRPHVRFYDTGLDATSTVDAYRRAVADGAQLVVGPIARDDVEALFAQTEFPAPMLALNRAATTPPPPGSASFALAPEDEGIAAAERLLRRGARRVIAVAGEDESSQRSIAAFRDRIEQRDAQVVAQISLPESSPDYAPLIRQALAAAGTRTTAPDPAAPDAPAGTTVEADALFLAVRPAQARLFVPQLRVAGVYDLPIVATSQIASGGANARLDRELDGVEFTEVPWLIADAPGVPAREALSRQLESARGGGARLFAFGMDAFRLLGFLDHLGADPNQRVVGATGELRLDGFGQVQRTPGWARFSNGHVQAAPDGSLTSDGIEYREP